MLREDLNSALKGAMRDRDQITVATIRLILAALKDNDIAARTRGDEGGVSDDGIRVMLKTMIKQRRESIRLYEQGGRLDLAEREQAEIGVIERFLPRQLDAAETEQAVAATIAEIDAKCVKEMGRTMAALRERYADCMDFGVASKLVKARLIGC